MDALTPPPDYPEQTLTDVFVGGRGSGKTTFLVGEWLDDSNGILVVPTRDRIRPLRNSFDISPSKEKRIMTITDLLEGVRLMGTNAASANYYIDDMEDCLRQLLHRVTHRANIKSISITGKLVDLVSDSTGSVEEKPVDKVEELRSKINEYEYGVE